LVWDEQHKNLQRNIRSELDLSADFGQVNILAIMFMDTLNGVAGGNGDAYTSNGGTNWINTTSIPGSGSINGFAHTSNLGEMFYTRGTLFIIPQTAV
jgi:hypothetical protein